MKNELRKFIETLTPFLFGGVAIALCIGLLIIFSYVLIWGLVIGLVFWLIFMLKQFIFPSTPKLDISTKSGKIIEHDDKK